MKKLIFSLLSFSLLASAQSFYWNAASARSIALGGVYVPSSTGVLDALATNPAGLSSLSGASLDLSITGAFARGSFTNAVNSGSPMTTSPGAIAAGAFGAPIGTSRFSFGIGEVPELTTVSEWNYVDSPGVAGATYGAQHPKSAILATRSVAGLGIALGQRVSVGVSVGADYNSNTLEAPYIFQSQPVVKGLKTLLNLHTNGVGWNTSVGATVRVSRKVQISGAWKSRTVIESTGTATGTLDKQLAAVGLAARPDYAYSAAVRNVLPQSVTSGLVWRADSRWMLALQTDWVNWKRAFKTLPVALTNGNNQDVNGLLGSTSLNDGVPLDWKDQFTARIGFERLLTEAVTIRGGYAHSTNPVPSSTLTPLTAAIFSDQFGAGMGYRKGRARFDLGYSFDPTAKESVGTSALLSGEYNSSTVKVGVQTVTLSTSFRF